MVEFKQIQDKWQLKWKENHIFRATEDKHKKKFYCLEMFPYPSASFLHMGHVRNYSIGDAIARFKRMNGYNVLYPMGYDSFGLPAENAAKKAGIHPREYTENAIKVITKYFQELGLSHDWDRTLATHEPKYYKWNQHFFIKFYENGLVYRKKAKVNFCLHCNTVLANEEVEKGKCWRCDNDVVEKDLDQWFFKTTAYSDQLLEDMKKLDWSEKIKTIQENWIGKSYGTLINFKLENGEVFPIFTTRPDTIFGVTFMVIALNHPKLKVLIKGTQYEKTVENFVEDVKKAELAEDTAFLEKSGVFTGLYAINPLNNEKVPIYAGNFVVADYATGMIMAVPAHDERDYQFAKKYGIEIKQVITPNVEDHNKTRKVLTELKKIKEAADKKGIRFWLLGGLAHAFYYGTIYRQHLDLDLIVKDKAQENKFSELLISLGFKKKAEKKLTENLTNIIYENAEGIEVEIGPHAGEFGVLDSDFEEDEKQLNGVKCLVMSKRYLVKFKEFLLKVREHKKDAVDLDKINNPGAYVDDGILVHSEQFNGLGNRDAIDKITAFIEKSGMGKKTIQYRLKDWLISRQRYWGTPIPMIHCSHCGIVPVPYNELPLLLPDDVKFSQIGNPLLTSKTFVHCKCPKCHGDATRETDTMGGFMDSSWYFLRYCSPQITDVPFDREAVKYWMPVDQYVGGIEHAVGHLIYSRFFTKALRDMNMLDIDEPFNALFNQGIVYKDGKKMSKSYGNVVTQIEIAEKYGIDTARLFLLFVAAPDKEMEWSDQGIEGTYKFLTKTYRLYEEKTTSISDVKDAYLVSKQHIVVRSVTNDITNFKLNNAIVTLMDFVNYIYEVRENVSSDVLNESLEVLALLLNPFAPHLSEECNFMMGKKEFASISKWPIFDEEKIDLKLHYLDELIASTVKDVKSVLELAKIENPKAIEIIISEEWKYEFYNHVKTLVSSGMRNIGELSKSIMNSELKKHGQEIMKMLPKIIDKFPEQILSQEQEKDAFLAVRIDLSAKFNCDVLIVAAEHSKEAKAKQANPGKPAIVVK